MRLTSLLVAVLLCATFHAPWVPLAAADPTYSLEDDFLTSPSQSNSAADRWQYFTLDPTIRDGSYTRLLYYRNPAFANGNQGWEPTETIDLPFVCKNTTASNLTVPLFGGLETPSVPSQAVWVHPLAFPEMPAEAAAVALLVPETGTYVLSGSIKDLDTGNGDGVLWYLDRNDAAGNLDFGSYADGGSDSFSLTELLTAGDLVYLIVAPSANSYKDSTRLTFQASLVPEPFSMAFMASAFVGVVGWRVRRRRRRGA